MGEMTKDEWFTLILLDVGPAGDGFTTWRSSVLDSMIKHARIGPAESLSVTDFMLWYRTEQWKRYRDEQWKQ